MVLRKYELFSILKYKTGKDFDILMMVTISVNTCIYIYYDYEVYMPYIYRPT